MGMFARWKNCMLMMNEGNSLRRIFIISQIGVTLLLGISASIFLSQKDWSVYSRHKSVCCVLIVKTLTIELVKGNLNFIKFEWLGNVLLGLSAAVVVGTSLCFARFTIEMEMSSKLEHSRFWHRFLTTSGLAKWQQLIASLSSYWFHNFLVSANSWTASFEMSRRTNKTSYATRERRKRSSEFYN